MGWVFIVLVIIGFSSLAILAKIGMKKNVSAIDICFSLFLVSSIICVCIVPFSGSHTITKENFLLGLAAGISSVFALMLFYTALKTGHYGFSIAIIASSFIIPVVYSFSAGWENNINIFGITLVMTAIFLMTYAGDTGKRENKIWGKWFALIMLAFLFNGIPQITQAIMARISGGDKFLYVFWLYLSGAFVLSIFVFRNKTFTRTAFYLGFLSALGSMTGIICTLLALEYLPPSVVFPSYYSGYTLVGVVVSKVIFKEKISIIGYIGIAMAVAGLVILSCR